MQQAIAVDAGADTPSRARASGPGRGLAVQPLGSRTLRMSSVGALNALARLATEEAGRTGGCLRICSTRNHDQSKGQPISNRPPTTRPGRAGP